MPEHPVAILRRELAQNFTDELPNGVQPVRQWCRDPQFFPGATGLVDADAWSEVQPGNEATDKELGPVAEGGVVVVGNYQATASSYQSVCDGSIGDFPTTWRELRRLLQPVTPRDVFLTNAFIGVPDLPNDTAPFPTTPEYTRRCGQLLKLELKLSQPRCVLCLGVPAAKMLATLSEELAPWRPWPGYGALEAAEMRVVNGCFVGATKFTAVAVQHPSAVLSNSARAQDAQLIEAASRRRT